MSLFPFPTLLVPSTPSRGHEYLLTAGYDGKVVVWSIAATQNMQPTVAFTLDPGPSGSDELLAVCFVPLSHSKGLVVAGGNAGFLDVWQFDSGQIICRIPSQPSGLSTLCAAPNKCILTGMAGLMLGVLLEPRMNYH